MTMPAQKPGASRQDYGTPTVFLDAVKKRLQIERFDIDLAASHLNTVADMYYDEQQNALVQPWKMGDGWNWLNPPFARIEPWVQRAYEQARDHNAHTAVLIPAGVGANWWRDWTHDKCEVLLLNGRLSFDGIAPYPKDCALLLYHHDGLYWDRAFYDVWNWREQR